MSGFWLNFQLLSLQMVHPLPLERQLLQDNENAVRKCLGDKCTKPLIPVSELCTQRLTHGKYSINVCYGVQGLLPKPAMSDISSVFGLTFNQFGAFPGGASGYGNCLTMQETLV